MYHRAQGRTGTMIACLPPLRHPEGDFARGDIRSNMSRTFLSVKKGPGGLEGGRARYRFSGARQNEIENALNALRIAPKSECQISLPREWLLSFSHQYLCNLAIRWHSGSSRLRRSCTTDRASRLLLVQHGKITGLTAPAMPNLRTRSSIL